MTVLGARHGKKSALGLHPQLEDKTLDIGLLRLPLLKDSAATIAELERDGYIAALPRGNPLASKGILDLADMANESFMMYAPGYANGLFTAAMLACQQAGFIPRITQEAIQIQTVLALVESGLGVALVPSIMQRFVSDKIVYRPFKDFPVSASIGLALAYMTDSEIPATNRFRLMASRVFSPVTGR